MQPSFNRIGTYTAQGVVEANDGIEEVTLHLLADNRGRRLGDETGT